MYDMPELQIRLRKGQIEFLDNLVADGTYSSRTAAIRDAVRRLINYYRFGHMIEAHPMVNVMVPLRTTKKVKS
ncbi:ribbon-helix-helix domain-containing protein [Candidatus Poribacteria bacterium]